MARLDWTLFITARICGLLKRFVARMLREVVRRASANVISLLIRRGDGFACWLAWVWSWACSLLLLGVRLCNTSGRIFSSPVGAVASACIRCLPLPACLGSLPPPLPAVLLGLTTFLFGRTRQRCALPARSRRHATRQTACRLRSGAGRLALRRRRTYHHSLRPRAYAGCRRGKCLSCLRRWRVLSAILAAALVDSVALCLPAVHAACAYLHRLFLPGARYNLISTCILLLPAGVCIRALSPEGAECALSSPDAPAFSTLYRMPLGAETDVAYVHRFCFAGAVCIARTASSRRRRVDSAQPNLAAVFHGFRVSLLAVFYVGIRGLSCREAWRRGAVDSAFTACRVLPAIWS